MTMRNGALPVLIAAMLFCQAVTAVAGPQDDYVGFSLVSWHFGNNGLNDFNPGVTYGRRFEIPGVTGVGICRGRNIPEQL